MPIYLTLWDKNIDNENQKTDNDSFISNPSSIFDDCPYKRLVYQLKKVITRAKTRITDSRNEKEILDMTLEKIKSAQKLYYQRAPKLKNLSHHEQDYLEYQEEELEALQITVARLINKINIEIEKRRRMPRNSLPSFCGNALEWYNYKGEILELASTIEDEKQNMGAAGKRREEELLAQIAALEASVREKENRIAEQEAQVIDLREQVRRKEADIAELE